MRRDRGPARLLYRFLDRALLPRLAGVNPDLLTAAGLGFSALAGLAYTVSAPLAGLLILAGGLCDILDGQAARNQGRAGPRGAFLDSVLDRYGECFVFMGLAAHFHLHSPHAVPGVALVFLALTGAFLVSYTRARGEGLGASFQGGWFTRDVRLIVLAAGSLAEALYPGPALLGTVALLALGANVTAARRLVAIRRLLDRSRS